LTDVYSLILEELTESKACHVDRFPPFYILSVGAHLLNLTNKRKGIYFEGRRIPDLRVHIMFNAPPGGEKSFWLEQFLRGEQAILMDSGIGIVMKGSMTEAGFVGTTRFEGGEKVVVPGICKTHMSDIVGIEEFAAVTQSLSQEHSRTLDPALLGALDSGWVYKDLAAGSISYETRLTLWGATQPARFDLRSGMARRFLFINNIPTMKDLAEIRLARRNSKNVRYNPVRTDRIRQELKDLKARVEGIESITWDEEVIYTGYDKLKLLHWEEKLYDNMLMGYWIMRGKFDRELHVTLDDTITNYILQEARHRDTIRRGSEFAEILLLMREHNGEIEEFVLKDELLAFGKDWRQSRQLIDDLIHIRALVRMPNGILKLSANLRGNKVEGEKVNG